MVTLFAYWTKKTLKERNSRFIFKEKEIFGIAGLWENWLDKETGGLTETCTIITTEANEVFKADSRPDAGNSQK